MLPLYPELYPTVIAFWAGVLAAVVHYIIRRRVVELFGMGFGLIVVSSAGNWWASGIIAGFFLYLGYAGIAYMMISGIILVLKAVQYSASVLSRTVVYSVVYSAEQQSQGQKLMECRCTCQ
jgi:hypothetical protein